MKIVRTEKGQYVREITLDVDDYLVETINFNFKSYLKEDEDYIPLTVTEVWNILKDLTKAPRFNEMYSVKLPFFEGRMKLGDFVRMEVNDILQVRSGDIVDEVEDSHFDFFVNS